MKRAFGLMMILGVVAVSASMAGATDYDVSPADLAAGKTEFSQPHGTGTNPFGYDWDSARPEIAAGAPDGYGTESFYASVVNSSDGSSPDSEAYRTFRIGLTSLFGRSVSLGEIASIVYQTNKPAAASAIDWRLSIYTTVIDGAGDNRSSWYRDRIQNHPSLALNLDAPANEWNLWSTDVGTNQMLFSIYRTGFTAENIAWSELTGGTVTRGAYTRDVSGDEVMMIDILLGANSGGGTGSSQLDGIVITLADGSVANINAIPEPATMGLLAVGLAAVVARRRNRK